MLEEIDAAGAVVWRPDPGDETGGTVQIAVVHRPRYDDWSLPKGKLEPGETSRIAAAREVAEETGFRIVLGRHLDQVRYHVNRPRPATKVVDYYAGRAREGGFEPNDEVDELCWRTPEAAATALTYPHDRRVVSAFTALPAELGTLLLVRHAKAGSRREWDGPDEQRPLSANGRHQVPSIRALAALYGVDRVFSAPLARCEQTVAEIADDAGVAVLSEPLVSEKGYRDAEERAVARLLEIAAGGGAAVVCSQGGVIPDLLSRVAGVAGAVSLPVSGEGLPESRKGSVWALFFTTGEDPELAPKLVAAEYLKRP